VNSVTWSPDGSRLAFTGFLSPGSAGGLYVTDLIGGSPTKVADDAIRPMWSPDGSMIAYLGAKLPHRPADQWSLTVATVRPDGSDVTTLLRTGSCDCVGVFPSITWSPDGTEIAAFVPPPGQREDFGLYVMQADGSRLRRVPDAGWAGHSISWRPVP
jgi:Tol biopolymer transport system component